MKRILNLSYCIGFFLLYITSGYCQKKFKFGDVTPEEFKNNTTKDSTVGAVVLFDIGKSYFSTTATHIQLIFEHHRRIKILTKDGYDWANGRIELMSSNSSEETVSKFDATTYNLENGKVVPTAMKKDGIFNDKVIDDYLIKKFTLPNVKEGSIIEYKYKITSPFIFNIQPWTFQENIPVQLSQYSCEIPSFFQFKTEMKGFEPISTEVKKEVKAIIPGDPTHVENYVFTGNNLPSFQEESYLTSAENYKTSVEFEISSINIPGTFSKPLLNDWPHICARLLEDEDFGKILERKGAVKEKVDSVIKGSKTEEEKMISIYNFVRSSFKWNGDNGVSASQRLKKTLEEKRGNAGDINLLLTLMLRAAGLPADPVILSTRKHGMINPYLTPMAKKYNYVIGHVKLGETKYMLDATDAWRPYDVLPERCINGQGRLIAQNSSEWVDLKNNETFTGLDILQLNLSEEGEMEGEINCLRKSYAAFLAREKVGKKPSDYLEAKKK